MTYLRYVIFFKFIKRNLHFKQKRKEKNFVKQELAMLIRDVKKHNKVCGDETKGILLFFTIITRKMLVQLCLDKLKNIIGRT